MRWLPIVTTMLLCSSALSASAEDPGEAAASASTDVHHADEIVVADETLRPAELFQDVAVETEILTEEVIDELPATNVAEALESLPGIRIQRRVQGEAAAVSIEGLPPAYTMILVNGQRYSGEFGGVDDLRDIPLANVARIEIRRGANGLRYGPEAGGGVIDIVTKDPPLSGTSVDVSAGGGDDGKVVANVTPAVGWRDYGLSATYEYDRIGGFEAPSDTQGRTQIPFTEDSVRSSHDLYGTLRWSPNSAFSSRSRFGWRLREEDLVNESSVDPHSERRYERWLTSQEWGIDVGEFSHVGGAFTYLAGETRSDVGRSFEMDEDEFKVDLAGDRFFELGSAGANLSLGGDFRRTTLDLEQQAFLAPDDTALSIPPDARESFLHGGIYLIGELELASWLSTELGVRGQFHSDFSPKLLPHGAVMITPWQRDDGRSLKLRLSAGRNYRIPTLRELYQPPVAQLGGAYFLSGNEDLDPEQATSYRVGIELNPISWLSTSLTGFYNDIEDHIRSEFHTTITTGYTDIPPDTSPGSDCDRFGSIFPELCDTIRAPIPASVYRKTNLDDVTTRGVEARVNLRPHRLVDLQVGYTYLDTEVRDSNVGADELPNEPRHVVDTRVVLTAPVVDTRLTVRTRWRSSAVIEGSGTGLLGFSTAERSDPSWNVDLRVQQPLFERYTLFADVYNVTDNRFVDSYVVRGRSFFIGLRATFD